jgi:hypothetical protein
MGDDLAADRTSALFSESILIRHCAVGHFDRSASARVARAVEVLRELSEENLREEQPMLDDDPPPGTPVKFVRDVGLVKALSRATLKRPLGRYPIERPDDLFEVEYLGDLIKVERQDIERR